MSKRILIVEDESTISDVLKINLEQEGYTVEVATDGEQAIRKTNSFLPDLILLDIMIPIMDGFQVCVKVRESFNMPIIMLTAKSEESDMVLGLEKGADDYITKPFKLRELMARVKANLRRFMIEPDPSESLITLGDLVIDTSKYEVSKRGKVVPLTFREFELIKYFAYYPNQVFSREKLLTDVWGYVYAGDGRTVDVTVRRIREKLEDDGSNPRYLLTKRGVGYYLTKYLSN